MRNKHVNPKYEFTLGNALEMSTMLSKAYNSICSTLLCEVISGCMKEIMHIISKNKKMNSDLELELILHHEDLQSALTKYINSLGNPKNPI